MKTFISIAALACVTAAAATASELRTTTVLTHPSQGDTTIVEGGVARLSSDAQGAFLGFETNGLTPGNVHTLWFVTIADPSACTASPCSGKDVLTNADGVRADVAFAAGAIADDRGAGRFAAYRQAGAMPDGWFGHGFAGADRSEVHLVVKDHGPLIEGRAEAMLSTFRDACTEESIAKPFPPVARADGAAGPNTCAMVQFAVFAAPEPNS